MSVFDEKARDWDTTERRERAEAVAEAIRERAIDADDAHDRISAPGPGCSGPRAGR